METVIHRSETRGGADHGWLKAQHSFSFASYFDQNRMGFGLLRVLNDDVVAPAKGFGKHPHDNMEIVTIPLRGALRHKDSFGNEAVIKEGEVQLMSAGTGVTHSEFNDSPTEIVNLLQIWVLPKKIDIAPRYEQSVFPVEERKNRMQVVVSPMDKSESGLKINQDAYFSLSDLDEGQTIEYKLRDPKHGVYLFVIDGEISVGKETGKDTLKSRDAMGLAATDAFQISITKNSQLLFIEVPMQ